MIATDIPRKLVLRFPILIVLAALWPVPGHAMPTCLFISSYHQGYTWSDEIEAGLRKGLDRQCAIKTVYMDTKRKKSQSQIKKAATDAYTIYQQLSPDVVITADDNAAKFFIVPYLKGKDTPVVFSGINWTVEEYGFPVSNITGIVEVAPYKPMIDTALQTQGIVIRKNAKVAFLGADDLSNQKSFNYLKQLLLNDGIEITGHFVDSMEEWLKAFKDAQGKHVLVLGSENSIADWDQNRAVQSVHDNARTLVVTYNRWSMPYAHLGFTKVPVEHGEWAAQTTVAVLNGTAPANIPIATNRRWDSWINKALVARSTIKIPHAVRSRAKIYR